MVLVPNYSSLTRSNYAHVKLEDAVMNCIKQTHSMMMMMMVRKNVSCNVAQHNDIELSVRSSVLIMSKKHLLVYI